MAGSAIGNWGEERFDIAAKSPGMTKITTTYIQKVAQVVGDITKDPQLMAIAQGLGSRLPQEAPEGRPQDVPAEDPTAEEPPVEEPPPSPPVGILGV